MSSGPAPAAARRREGPTPHVAALFELGPPAADADLVVIALHGRERPADEMIRDVVEPARALLGADADRIAWVVPEATGRSWYPGRASEVDAGDERVAVALASFGAIEDVVARRRADVVALGFSQGASVATEYVARHPARWAGAVSLTGTRIGRPGEEVAIDGDLGGTPVYFSTGDDDEWAPVERVITAAADFVRAGADLTLDVIAGRDHVVSRRELGRVADLLSDALGDR